MINYETIISNFDDKVTLYNWLRKVEEALKNASATNFVVNKKGNATLSFSITFADGETLESGDIVLQQGESVDQARIASGILQLHLTNGTWLTAGNLKPVSNFSIDENQHLIVNYQDGTSQDLGAIFTGNVAINGNLVVTNGNISIDSDGNVEAKTLEPRNAIYNDNLSIYITNCQVTDYYSKIIISNNILYLIFNFKFKNTTSAPITLYTLGTTYVNIPQKYAQKVYDLNGHTAHDSDNNFCLITLFKGFIADNLSGDNRKDLDFKITNTTAQNQIVVYQETSDGLTLDVNEEKFITARVMLTLF